MTPICRWCAAPAACRRFVTLAPAGLVVSTRPISPRPSPTERASSFSTTRSIRPASSTIARRWPPRPVLRQHDAIALCDEVWEHVVFDGRRHLPLIAMAGMRERTVKIGSAGKIFSLTGWKVGFVCSRAAPHEGARQGPPVHHLYDAAQPAERRRLRPRQEDSYFASMRADFQRSRDRFSSRSRRARLRRLAQRRHLFRQYRHSAARSDDDDFAFCTWLVEQHGVAAIPVSAFLREGRDQNGGSILLRQAGRDARWRSGAARKGAVAAPPTTHLLSHECSEPGLSLTFAAAQHMSPPAAPCGDDVLTA